MVSAVRHGRSLHAVAQQFRVSPATVYRWVQRAGSQRLDRVDFADRSSRPQQTRRTARRIEDRVLALRQTLRTHSALGEYGAVAIHRTLQARGTTAPVPSVRTIGRILERRGALDGQRRVRRPAPPPGWYLPTVWQGRAELDSFDLIEELKIAGGPLVDVLTGCSLHGGLPGAWPERAALTAQTALQHLLAHWRTWGLPAYAQFDNDTRFQGAHQHRDVISRVMRLCLSLQVTPVFAPPREHGVQNLIEHFNGRWQAVVWHRFPHRTLRGLQLRSDRYLRALRAQRAVRLDAAPQRRPVPRRWRLDLQRHPQGTLVYLRRTDARGRVSVLGHTFSVDRHWAHRLARCEVDLTRHRLRCYALRRRAPEWQPLLKELGHTVPRREFRE